MFDKLRRLLAGVETRADSQLGTLERYREANCWIATLPRGERDVKIVIEGGDAPHPALLARGRELVSELDTLERLTRNFLAREAQADAWKEGWDGALPEEIAALRIAELWVRSPDRPRYVRIEFESPDEMKYWTCDYEAGALSDLRFQT